MMLLNKEKFPDVLARALSGKVLIALLSGWLFLSVIQTVHFYWYFEQTLWNSVRWSFRDWFVWFAIFGVLLSVLTRHAHLTKFSAQNLVFVAFIALACGFLQTLIVVSLDFIAGTATRAFWDDFWRFYSKRWLQHLFVFAIFWLLMLNRFFESEKGSAENRVSDGSIDAQPSKIETSAVENRKQQKIQISDGTNSQWVEQSDIFCVEAAGNYVCFHTVKGQLISRSSLKQIEESLDDDSFMRVSRSNIVNLTEVTSSHRVSRSKVELTLSNEHTVTIGPTYWKAIKQRLEL